MHHSAMQFDLHTRNQLLGIFLHKRGWLSAPFIATILHTQLRSTTSLSEDVEQLAAFLDDLPEVEESGGMYRLKDISQQPAERPQSSGSNTSAIRKARPV
jgi:hypothetical protein